MITRTMSKQQALDIFTSFVQAQCIPPESYANLNPTYSEIRQDLLSMWLEAKRQKGEYQKDIYFGLKIYEYFNDRVNLNTLENVEFWIYLCCAVVPDIVFERFGLNDLRFFKKSGRIYLQSLWQFIHMCYQGSIEETRKTVETFNTDYIMQLSERSGLEGYYVEVYREIIRQLSLLPQQIVNRQVNGANLCRRVMIQNTAKCDNYNLVFENEITEYVKMLYRACGVEVDDYEQITE